MDRLDGVSHAATRSAISSSPPCGPAAVEAVQKRGAEVFLDLKFHDIPNTVAGAAREATRHGRLHVQRPRLGRPRHDAGGRGGRRRGGAGAQACAARSPSRSPCSRASTAPRSSASWAWPRSVEGHVLAPLRPRAARRGSTAAWPRPTRSRRIRNGLGRGWVIVTPGVRPAGAALDDQSRVATPGSRGPRGRPLPRGRAGPSPPRPIPPRAAEAHPRRSSAS